jgi:hypothetical protein
MALFKVQTKRSPSSAWGGVGSYGSETSALISATRASERNEFTRIVRNSDKSQTLLHNPAAREKRKK